jgi:hypothetical protein
MQHKIKNRIIVWIATQWSFKRTYKNEENINFYNCLSGVPAGIT